MSNVFGFVVDSNEEFLLLHSFNSEVFRLNGYEVVRQSDIRRYCFFDDSRYWRFRALRRLKIKPELPDGICLASMRELLLSVAARYPLLSVHRETPHKRVTFVGQIQSVSERTFAIEDIDYFGRGTGARRMRYVDLTSVCFDGGYLTASAISATSSPKHTSRGGARQS
jgi:hypothetical protein